MKIVIDTNVVLDTLGVRQPFFEKSNAVMQLVAQGKIDGSITANTVTDIAYLMRKYMSANAIKGALEGLMDMLEVLEVNRNMCYQALDSPMIDFEDALLAACANRWDADFIVTRNVKDFEGSPVSAISPEGFLNSVVEFI